MAAASLGPLPSLIAVALLNLVEVGQPEAHDLAGRGHHHVSRTKLDAPNRVLVVALQRTDLYNGEHIE